MLTSCWPPLSGCSPENRIRCLSVARAIFTCRNMSRIDVHMHFDSSVVHRMCLKLSMKRAILFSDKNNKIGIKQCNNEDYL